MRLFSVFNNKKQYLSDSLKEGFLRRTGIVFDEDKDERCVSLELYAAAAQDHIWELHCVESITTDFGEYSVLNYDSIAGTATLMSTKAVGRHRMHPKACPRGWVDSELRKWLNTEVFNSLPKGLRSMIVPTKHVTVDANCNDHSVEDNLFLLTECELTNQIALSGRFNRHQFAGIRSDADRKVSIDGKSGRYWTSSVFNGMDDSFCVVSDDGSRIEQGSVLDEYAVPLCFTIG